MKTMTHQFILAFFSACLVLCWGCSRSDECNETRIYDAEGSERVRQSDGLDLSRDLEQLVQSFAWGDGTPIRRGETILVKITSSGDAFCRTNGLEQFRKAVFSIEFSGSDYTKLRNGLRSMERLQPLYLSSAFRCGCGLEENMRYRMDFLKWLKREMKRPLAFAENEIAKTSSPYATRIHVTKEDYQKSLSESYKLHLRWMEEEFNLASNLPAHADSVASVRRQIEDFLGRPIRTDEELLRDGGMK